MADPSFRVVAILKAKPGLEEALLDFTLHTAEEIRRADGLRRVEISRSTAEEGKLFSYYWWDSASHSQRYLSGYDGPPLLSSTWV